MKYKINGVMCDTYAHLDRPKVGDAVIVSASAASAHTVTAFLYCGNEAFPVGDNIGIVATCCIRSGTTENIIDATIGGSGEIIIQLPTAMYVSGDCLSCEINISTDGAGEDAFRYKAFAFRIVVVD